MSNVHESCGRRKKISWNENDTLLKSCIERSRFVKKIRKELREKR